MPTINPKKERRCVIRGLDGACQYRMVGPKAGKPCPNRGLLKQRLPCLRGTIRVALADADVASWKLTDDAGCARLLRTTCPELIGRIRDLTATAFPKLPAEKTTTAEPLRRCVALPSGACQYRLSAATRASCDDKNPRMRLSCALSQLRVAMRELFAVRSGQRVPAGFFLSK